MSIFVEILKVALISVRYWVRKKTVRFEVRQRRFDSVDIDFYTNRFASKNVVYDYKTISSPIIIPSLSGRTFLARSPKGERSVDHFRTAWIRATDANNRNQDLCRWNKDYFTFKTTPRSQIAPEAWLFYVGERIFYYPKGLLPNDRKRCSRVPVSRPLYVFCHSSLPSSTLWITWLLSCRQRTAPNFKFFKSLTSSFIKIYKEFCRRNIPTQFTLILF